MPGAGGPDPGGSRAGAAPAGHPWWCPGRAHGTPRHSGNSLLTARPCTSTNNRDAHTAISAPLRRTPGMLFPTVPVFPLWCDRRRDGSHRPLAFDCHREGIIVHVRPGRPMTTSTPNGGTDRSVGTDRPAPTPSAPTAAAGQRLVAAAPARRAARCDPACRRAAPGRETLPSAPQVHSSACDRPREYAGRKAQRRHSLGTPHPQALPSSSVGSKGRETWTRNSFATHDRSAAASPRWPGERVGGGAGPAATRAHRPVGGPVAPA